MKIISPFKDYYDHVGQKYGGGDPRIPYVRKRFKQVEPFTHIDQPPGISRHWMQHLSKEHQQKLDACVLKWLVVAGKYYLLVGSRIPEQVVVDFHILNTNKHEFLIEYLKVTERHAGRWWQRFGKKKTVSLEYILDKYVGASDSKLIALSKRFKAPVFTLVYPIEPSHNSMVLEKNIPILENLGMPSIISAEQMYQEIAHFVGNVMKEVPDADPPVSIQNREKIEKAGFDLRTSFRHRKNIE